MRYSFAPVRVTGLCLALLFFATACGGGGETLELEESGSSENRDAEENRDEWEVNGPKSYSMVQYRGCYCAAHGEIELVVEGGEIVEVRDPETGGPVQFSGGELTVEDVREEYMTIEELFDWIIEQRKAQNSVFEVTYNEELGYPTRVFLERSAYQTDDELTITITNLRVSAD